MAVIRDRLRLLRTATWLGWQVDANWASPFLFAVYALVRPLAAAMILVFMYLVIAGGNARGAALAYVIVGNALWAFVMNGFQGLSWAVLDERERYQMLKYVYISPVSLTFFLLGRSVTKLAAGALSAMLILAFAVLVLGTPIRLTQIDAPLLAGAMVLGLISICALGVALAGVSLALGRHSYDMSDAVAGTFYLLTGAIFPLHVLPGWLQAVGKAIPLTYWLEAVRRALLGSAYVSVLPGLGDGLLLLRLLGLTAVLVVVSAVVFRRMEHLAKERGLIDMQTGY